MNLFLIFLTSNLISVGESLNALLSLFLSSVLVMFLRLVIQRYLNKTLVSADYNVA